MSLENIFIYDILLREQRVFLPDKHGKRTHPEFSLSQWDKNGEFLLIAWSGERCRGLMEVPVRVYEHRSRCKLTMLIFEDDRVAWRDHAITWYFSLQCFIIIWRKGKGSPDLLLCVCSISWHP